MTINEESSKIKLKGQSNYLQWLKRFKTMAKFEKWGSFVNETYIPTAEASAVEETPALKWIMSNTGDDALDAFDSDLTVSQNLIKFKQTFGYGFLNPAKFEESIINMVVFDVSRNHNQVFIWIDRQLDILTNCGGTISQSLKRKIIMKLLQILRVQYSLKMIFGLIVEGI